MAACSRREDWPASGTRRNHDLLGMMLAADLLRRRAVGDVVTYVVNRKHSNFTNVCFIGCKFLCVQPWPARKRRVLPDRSTRSRSDSASPRAWATEVCVQGGLRASFRRFITATCFAP